MFYNVVLTGRRVHRYICVKHTEMISDKQIYKYQVYTDIHICLHVSCAQMYKLYCALTQQIHKMHDNEQHANEGGLGGLSVISLSLVSCRPVSGGRGSVYGVWFAHCNCAK